MIEYRLPTAGGRELLIRPCAAGERPRLQLALVSTHGNIMEAVTFEVADVLGLARGAARVARAAQEQHEREQRSRAAEAAESYREALARNPWLSGDLDHRHRESYIGRAR